MARGHKGGFVVLRFEFNEEDDGRWTARCSELGTATFGDSFDEAREAIEEAVGMHLDALEELGERERFFKENKIKLHRVEPVLAPPVRNLPISTLVEHRVRELEFA